MGAPPFGVPGWDRAAQTLPGRLVAGARGDELGVLAAEGFRDVAVPADRPVGRENFGKFFRRHLGPLHGAALGVEQRRAMVVPVDFPERLAAVGALLAGVPGVDDLPYRAGFRVGLDFAQAVLPAAFPLRPARGRPLSPLPASRFPGR